MIASITGLVFSFDRIILVYGMQAHGEMKPCKVKQPRFLIISLLFLCLHMLFLLNQAKIPIPSISFICDLDTIHGKYRCALEHNSKWVLIEMHTALQCDGSSDDRRHRQKKGLNF